MRNLEVIALAEMSMHPETDSEGKKRKFVTFDLIHSNVIRREHAPSDVRCQKTVNPYHTEAEYYEWFLTRPVRLWLRDMKMEYNIYWRETTIMPTWYSPRFYILEVALPDATAAMLFKLAWGGK